jgi:hypothetical protein
MSSIGGEGGVPDHQTEMLLILNKISNKTYLDSIDTIVGIFKSAPDSVSEALDDTVLKVFTTNKFYVVLYADVFSICVQHRPSLWTCLDKHFSLFITQVSDIEMVDPVDEYDLFCKNNLKQEKQKTMSAFIMKITQNGIVPCGKYLAVLVDVLLSSINQHINNKQSIHIVDVLIDHISIVYKPECLSEEHVHLIKQITSYKPKQFPGLSSRSIFTLMHII